MNELMLADLGSRPDWLPPTRGGRVESHWPNFTPTLDLEIPVNSEFTRFDVTCGSRYSIVAPFIVASIKKVASTKNRGWRLV